MTGKDGTSPGARIWRLTMTIATMRAALTQDDIRRLVRGETPEERAQAASKICRRIGAADLSPQDRDKAQAILEMMAADAAELVRGALAQTLRHSRYLPRELALRLARDVDMVAIPILSNSPSLSDQDLVELLEEGSADRQTAIARRPVLSEELTGVICLKASVCRFPPVADFQGGAGVASRASDPCCGKAGDPGDRRSLRQAGEPP